MFRALQCPSSGARQTAVAASCPIIIKDNVVVDSLLTVNNTLFYGDRKPEAATAV
jgi:hypothetical protein